MRHRNPCCRAAAPAPAAGPRRVALALVAGLAWATPGLASEELTLYVDFGGAVPSDPPEFGEFWNPGPTVGGGLGIRFSEYWEAVATVHYQRFPANEAAQADDLLLAGFGDTFAVESIDGRNVTVVTVMAEARFHVPSEGSRLRPYLGFGWGYFEIYTGDAVVTPRGGAFQVTILGDSDAAFGASVGGGLEITLGPGTFLFGDLAYTIGFTERLSTQYLPLRIGMGFRL